MINLRVTIYERSEDLPSLSDGNFFHSEALFRIYESTPRVKPYMVVVSGEDGGVVCHLLGAARRRAVSLPPFFYSHCIVLGEGGYDYGGPPTEDLFGLMLETLTRKLQGKVLYIEFSHLCSKMFGYGIFRRCGYYPIHWLNVSNSLHSKAPEERVSAKVRRRVERAAAKGVTVDEVDGEADMDDFVRLLRRHNILKPKRYIPDACFFRGLQQAAGGKLFLTRFKGRAIGCCACVCSSGNAYLWYLASLRKSYVRLHPGAVTIWHAIKQAHANGYAHICFMDVGLPFQKSPYRDFILQFGGKPVSTYRWFRFSVRWVNSLLAWFNRD